MPRQYVYRAAVAEVFLTGWRADGPDTFTVAAQWPRAHAYFTPVAGRLDPLLLAETVRRTGALLAHAEYQVPTRRAARGLLPGPDPGPGP
ncbi:AfsA-related hotdog domain-containing protein [Streptomyces rubradiris]|uniref:A-factor biosynthesis hotdog domain-containing protein n=1 Tax=Streptomyces rubradiris TaxID=285531 RepID=A0ABQ3RFK5_STRRR|nr:AfsA-related hotdog domain-containing protein [Streptomyces rubradiris]GHG96606.1 hypothetical protein GCM10018792_07760 [Streptomyces rubradiris]GHI54606.1 hypothetical protein Srubr_44520 [Streptomyces rubradiris]